MMGFSNLFGLGKAFVKIVGILVSLFCSCIWTTMADDYDCDKYCNNNCTDYFGGPGSEFRDCVSANVYCKCKTESSNSGSDLDYGLTILWVFGLVAASFSVIVCCCVMCQKWIAVNGSAPQQTVMRAPVTPTTGLGYRSPYSNPYPPTSTSTAPVTPTTGLGYRTPYGNQPTSTSASSVSSATPYPVVATPVPVNQGLVQNTATEYTPPPRNNDFRNPFNLNGQSRSGFSKY